MFYFSYFWTMLPKLCFFFFPFPNFKDASACVPTSSSNHCQHSPGPMERLWWLFWGQPGVPQPQGSPWAVGVLAVSQEGGKRDLFQQALGHMVSIPAPTELNGSSFLWSHEGTDQGCKEQRDSHEKKCRITEKVTIPTKFLLLHDVQLVNHSSPLAGGLHWWGNFEICGTFQ